MQDNEVDDIAEFLRETDVSNETRHFDNYLRTSPYTYQSVFVPYRSITLQPIPTPPMSARKILKKLCSNPPQVTKELFPYTPSKG